MVKMGTEHFEKEVDFSPPLHFLVRALVFHFRKVPHRFPQVKALHHAEIQTHKETKEHAHTNRQTRIHTRMNQDAAILKEKMAGMMM